MSNNNAIQPDYGEADSFQPADAANFRVGSAEGRKISRVVIHITGGGTTQGNVGEFQNPNLPKKKSAHYIVGKKGEIVQMVRHKDISFHAGGANADSIGIEHVASAGQDLTKQQYESSAALTRWLCDQYGIPLDREHILGHKEADPTTDHACPGKHWDWDQYMLLVRDVATQAFSFSATFALRDRGWHAQMRVKFTMRGKGIGMNNHPLARNVWSCLDTYYINLLAWDSGGGFWYENNQYRCYDKWTTRQDPAFVLEEPPAWDGDNKHQSNPGTVQILKPRNPAGSKLNGTWTRIE